LGAAAVLAPTQAQADEVLQEFNEPGAADTPTAADALRMTGTARLVKRDQSGVYLVVDIHTENSAVTDNGTGCVKITLTKASVGVSQYITCSPRNPARGKQPATARDGHAEYLLPAHLQTDGLGFAFYNDDHRGGVILTLENVGKVVAIAASVVAML
jgi:hypothetical protein